MPISTPELEAIEYKEPDLSKIDISKIPTPVDVSRIDLSKVPVRKKPEVDAPDYDKEMDGLIERFSQQHDGPTKPEYVRNLVAMHRATGIHPDLLHENKDRAPFVMKEAGRSEEIYTNEAERRAFIPDWHRAESELFADRTQKSAAEHTLDVLHIYGKYRKGANGYLGLQGAWDAEAVSQIDRYALPKELFVSPGELTRTLGADTPKFLEAIGMPERTWKLFERGNLPLPVPASALMGDSAQGFIPKLRGIAYGAPGDIPAPELTLERAAKSVGEGAKKLAKDQIIGLQAGIDALNRHDETLAKGGAPGPGESPMLPWVRDSMMTPEQRKQTRADTHATLGRIADGIELDPEYLNSSGFVEDLLKQTPQVAEQVLLALSTAGLMKTAMRKLPGLAAAAGKVGMAVSGGAMFSQILGSKYQDLRAKGVDEDRAFGAAFLDAVLQTPMEQPGLGAILKGFTGAGNLGKKLLGIVEAAATEGVTEFSQQFVDDFTKVLGERGEDEAAVYLARYMKNLPQTAKDGLYAALIGSVLGGAAHTAGIGVSAVQQRRMDAQQFNDVLKSVESQLKEMAPSIYEEVRTRPTDFEVKEPGKEAKPAPAPTEAAPPMEEDGRSKAPVGYRVPEGRTIEQEAVLITRAMGQVESGNRNLKPGENWGEYGGRFQFQSATWAAYSREYNRVLFQNDAVLPMTPENQEAVTQFKVRGWLEKGYSPRQIAAIWNSGSADWVGKVGKGSDGPYDVPRHVAKVERAYRAFEQGKQVPVDRQDVARAIGRAKGITPAQVDKVMAVVDAAAESWAETYGRTSDEWYGATFASFEESKTPEEFKRKVLELDRVAPSAQQAIGLWQTPVESPEFKTWFGKSKVVDESGAPLVVYHGTRAGTRFGAFTLSGPTYDEVTGEIVDTGSGGDPSAMLGAHFAKEPEVASGFATGRGAAWMRTRVQKEGEAGPRIFPVRLRIENPKEFRSDEELQKFIYQQSVNNDVVDNILEQEDIEQEGASEAYGIDLNYTEEINRRAADEAFQYEESDYSVAQDLADAARKAMQDAGHDGVVYRNTVEGGTSYITFEPEQIKSIFNQGSFGINNPDILAQNALAPGEIPARILEKRGVDHDSTEQRPVAALSRLDRVDPSRTAASEAIDQIAILTRVRLPEQTIVTIKQAQDWLEAHGYPRIAEKGGAAATVEALLADPEFFKLNIFDRIRVAAQVERPLREKDYQPTSLSTKNKKTTGQLGVQRGKNNKTKGSNIRIGDTVAGCDHFCYECYALKGAQQNQINHQHPILREITGILHGDQVFRFGEKGDACKNWAWTHEQVAALLARSQAAGHDVTAEDNIFFITKLLSLDGFNADTAKNLEVTLDPMYPDHMKRSMENILRIKAAYPQTNITTRVRSFVTKNADLLAAQTAAVDFANRFKLPVLETRMRFIRKGSFDLLELDASQYKRKGSQFKLKLPQYAETANDHNLCDKAEEGCPGCKNCTKLMFDDRKRNLGRQNKAMKTEGVAGVPVELTAHFDPVGGAGILYQSGPTFYSQLAHTLEQKLPGSGMAPDTLKLLDAWAKKGEFKSEELDWSGIREYLAGQTGKVGKADVLKVLRQNQIEIREVQRGLSREDVDRLDELDAKVRNGESLTFEEQDFYDRYGDMESMPETHGGPKYEQYTEPGGENYRELLLQVPPKAGSTGFYRSGHWDELNVVAHVRVNDRTDVDGKRVLFLEEVQSVWHQEGRKKGYEGIPDAPFKSTWPLLAVKRMLRYAAENGYARVAWTTGAMQAERYDLSKQIDSIQWTIGSKPGRYHVGVVKDRVPLNELTQHDVTAAELENFIGKDLTQKILDQEASGDVDGTLSGLDLKVGGEGMKGFYDKILPAEVNKYVKKWGAKVGKTEIPASGVEFQVLGADGGEFGVYESMEDAEKARRENAAGGSIVPRTIESTASVHSVDVTPDMITSVLKGQPLFQDRGNPRGAAGFLRDGRAVLALFENADVSTVIHELAHVLRRQLRPEDMKIVEGWAGATDGEWTAEAEEKFARAFERYVMEGRAPSFKLRAVFAKMRKWLLDIYQSVKTLNAELPDDIRRVFDRLLTTEAQRNADALFQMDDDYSWVEPSADPIPLESITEYEQVQAEAARRAHAIVDRQIEKKRAKSDARFRADAEATLNEEPIWQLIKYVRAKGGVKLGTVRDTFGPDMVKALTRKYPGLISRAGKMRLDELAADYGYAGDDALTQAMLDLPGKADYIENAVAQMRRAFGFEEESDVLAWQERYIAEEIKVLGELLGPSTQAWKNVPRPGVKKYIDKEIVGKALTGKEDSEYRSLVAAMRMSQRNAAIAFREGRKEGALTEKLKQRELAQRLKVKIEAKKEVAQIQRDFKKWLKDKGIDWEYRQQLAALVASYDLKRKTLTSKIVSLREFVARQEAEGEAVDLPQDLLERLSQKPIGTLTVEELRKLHEAAEQIVHLGKLKKKLVDRNRVRDFNAVKGRVIDAIMRRAPRIGDIPKVPPAPSERRKGGKLSNFIDKLDRQHAQLLQPEFLIRAFDGFEDMGPCYQELFLPVKQAEDEKWRLLESIAQKWDEIRAPVKDQMHRWAKDRVAIPGLSRMLTREEHLMVALHARHEDNRAALVQGNQFTEAEINAVLASITPEEKTFLDRVVNEFIPIPRDLLQDTYKNLHGRPLKMVQGDYVPMKFDREASDFIAEKRAEADAMNAFKQYFTGTFMEKGMTIERKGGTQPLHLGFSAIFEHLSDTVQFATHGLPVRNLLKIFSDRAFRDAVKVTHGKNVLDQLKPWLKEVASPGARPLLPLEGILGMVRRNAVMFIMAYRMSTALQQPLAMMQAMDELGVSRTLDAAGKFLFGKADTGQSWSQFVLERSPAMRNRAQSFDRDLAAAVSGFDIDKSAWREGYERTAFALTAYMDGVAAQMTWLAAYQKAVNGDTANIAAGDEAAAIDYADGVVNRTQGSGTAKNLAAVARGTEVHKLFVTFFYSFFSTYHNRLWEAYRKLRQPGYEYNALDAMKSFVLLVVFPAILGEIASRGELPKEPKEPLLAVGRYMTSGLPLVRDAASAFSGYAYRGGLFGGLINELGYTANAVLSETKQDKAWRIVKHSLKLSGYLTGLPPDQALIILEAAMDPRNKKFTPDDLVWRERVEKKQK